MIIYHVTLSKLLHEYKSLPQEGVHRSLQWRNNDGFLEVYLSVGSVTYYHVTPMNEVRVSLHSILRGVDRIEGIVSQKKEVEGVVEITN